MCDSGIVVGESVDTAESKFEYDFFIAHAGSDLVAAVRLYELLIPNASLTVFPDEGHSFADSPTLRIDEV